MGINWSVVWLVACTVAAVGSTAMSGMYVWSGFFLMTGWALIKLYED